MTLLYISIKKTVQMARYVTLFTKILGTLPKTSATLDKIVVCRQNIYIYGLKYTLRIDHISGRHCLKKYVTSFMTSQQNSRMIMPGLYWWLLCASSFHTRKVSSNANLVKINNNNYVATIENADLGLIYTPMPNILANLCILSTNGVIKFVIAGLNATDHIII